VFKNHPNRAGADLGRKPVCSVTFFHRLHPYLLWSLRQTGGGSLLGNSRPLTHHSLTTQSIARWRLKLLQKTSMLSPSLQRKWLRYKRLINGLCESSCDTFRKMRDARTERSKTISAHCARTGSGCRIAPLRMRTQSTRLWMSRFLQRTARTPPRQFACPLYSGSYRNIGYSHLGEQQCDASSDL
jgi:hypothetical protein